ncbi:VOC family protein [Phenylobacterium sp. 58.2.17]|uniref:VOC family protein n=1 Tax=Phenylobacterium sp. 58.2.17 TaxID=2969306 RepID=UPI0022654076|nr:VOC family protein [Phenylobacterium sp. 58.2.17]MCX7586973.1 VOC family protein [Phenylobacterium sp. 58.2.17]
MISHVFIGADDLDRAMGFYGPVMEALGYPLKFVDPARGWAVWTSPGGARPFLIVGRPFEGAATPGNGQMTALLASSRPAVDQAYATALRNGGADEGAPSLRPQYHSDYYGAYVRDPGGAKLCFCCHAAE